LDKAMSCCADDYGIGRSDTLKMCREDGWLSQGKGVELEAFSSRAYDHQTRMNPDTYSQGKVLMRLKACLPLPYGIQYLQPAPYRPMRIILVCLGIAKIDQEAIVPMLRHAAVEACDNLHAGRMQGMY
jgi:hypothetical protein